MEDYKLGILKQALKQIVETKYKNAIKNNITRNNARYKEWEKKTSNLETFQI